MTIEQVFEVFTAAGFVADGYTAEEIVRIPTTRSPVFGGIGGERRKFGGRQRLSLPNTTIRATVGPRTTNIYRVINGKATFLANYKTTQLVAVELAAFLALVHK